MASSENEFDLAIVYTLDRVGLPLTFPAYVLRQTIVSIDTRVEQVADSRWKFLLNITGA